MKILPITTNNTQSRQISAKGGVTTEIRSMVKDMAASCRKYAQYQSVFNREAASKYSKYANAADDILFNLEKIMEQYPISSALVAKQSNKNPKNFRFYIDCFASHYKHIIGDVSFDENNRFHNIKLMADLTDKMAKESSYETNLRFKMFAKDPNTNIRRFLPEEENIMIEDVLKDYNI